jgi:hypothetical protein
MGACSHLLESMAKSFFGKFENILWSNKVRPSTDIQPIFNQLLKSACRRAKAIKIIGSNLQLALLFRANTIDKPINLALMPPQLKKEPAKPSSRAGLLDACLRRSQ